MAAREPVLVIAGPTAAGKSALALALAEARGGSVINADSMQLYADLPILTAQPGAAQRRRVPHHLFGVLDAADPASAARWRRLALAEIDAAHGLGRLPILVGGTGLYLEALLLGLSPVPPVTAAARNEARARLAAEGAPALHAALAAVDPEGAARLAPRDGQRLARAWEVWRATGRTLAAWQRLPRGGPPSGLETTLVVLAPPRARLGAAIDQRFGAMLAAGALDEVRRLRARGLSPDLPAMKALGVPELLAHLDARLTLEDAAAAARLATRQYAKRQMTWLRHRLPRRPEGAVGQILWLEGVTGTAIAEVGATLDRHPAPACG